MHDLGTTVVHPSLWHCRERVADSTKCTVHRELVHCTTKPHRTPGRDLLRTSCTATECWHQAEKQEQMQWELEREKGTVSHLKDEVGEQKKKTSKTDNSSRNRLTSSRNKQSCCWFESQTSTDWCTRPHRAETSDGRGDTGNWSPLRDLRIRPNKHGRER